jgi:hypothetical protein
MAEDQQDQKGGGRKEEAERSDGSISLLLSLLHPVDPENPVIPSI